MWSPRILVLRYPIYNGYQNTRNLKWTEVSEILKTTLVPATMPNSLLVPSNLKLRRALNALTFQTAKSVRDCATTVGALAFFQAQGYRGQAGQGAQGEGGEVGGVIMEDHLASAYRRRKGGKRKQR